MEMGLQKGGGQVEDIYFPPKELLTCSPGSVAFAHFQGIRFPVVGVSVPIGEKDAFNEIGEIIVDLAPVGAPPPAIGQ